MSEKIEAKEASLAELFSPSFMFRIPIYQRPLSWGKDNFDQLFEDIFDAATNGDKEYFLGSIILQQVDNQKNTYDLVDGQQRLTALAILMAVIRDSTDIADLKQSLTLALYQKADKYKGIPEQVRISPWEELTETFLTYVYQSDKIEEFKVLLEKRKVKYADTQDPNYRLYEAITVFAEKVQKNLEDPNKLEAFVKYLFNKVYIVYIKTSAFTSAFRLFNVLNTRGMPLNISDLLKSENLGKIDSAPKRAEYARTWREMEDILGREELENVLTFVRTVQVKEKAKVGIYEEYKKKIFEKKLLNYGEEFIHYVKEMSDIYTEKVLEGRINHDIASNNKYKTIIDLLRRFVPFVDWISPLMAFCQKFEDDKLLFDFTMQLEKKVIIEWVMGFSPTERITSLNRIIRFVHNEEDPGKVIKELLFYSDVTRLKMALLGGIGTLDYKNKARLKEGFVSKLDDIQFYGLSGGKLAKYILLRLDMESWELENFTGYPGSITVEHILPQKPSVKGKWVKDFEDAERNEWTNRLGNLVLLSGRKNAKARNYEFTKKKDVYFKEKSTPFRITQELQDLNKWTMEELRNRHKKLLELAERIFLDYKIEVTNSRSQN